jgi:hypothetical protein
MEQADALKLMIEDAVKRVTEPLEREVKALRQELEALKRGSQGADTPSSQATASGQTGSSQLGLHAPEPAADSSQATAEPGIAAEIPAERTDFKRFLQRGLEQEEKEYTVERSDAQPEKKRGWNPFKR